MTSIKEDAAKVEQSNTDEDYEDQDTNLESSNILQKNNLITNQTKSPIKMSNFPSVFSSSFSSLKSFARKSLSKDEVDLDKNENENENEDDSQLKIEKRNLIGMAKLSIKGLIESSLSAGHILDSDFEPLQQFFVIIEYVMRHGLRAPKNFFLQNKYFWPVLENIEKFAEEAFEITDSVRNLPEIRTNLGKGRAWLRLALMQKKLAYYIKMIVENKQFFSEWYENDALLMSDEGSVFIGYLVGLNCIDANLCMKGDDLDNLVTVIDYSLYMKGAKRSWTNSSLESEEKENVDVESKDKIIQRLTDQKNYLEERNRHLECSSSSLLKRSEYLEVVNNKLESELKASNIQLLSLQEDRKKIVSEKEHLTAAHQKTLEDREKDLDLERETLRHSKVELDEMFQQIQKQLRHEIAMRQDVERELELQMSLKQDVEIAMKLLEKDVYEKQDGVVTLREQLDGVKAINLEIFKKLQEKTALEEEKSRRVVDLEGETQKLATKVVKMQQQLHEVENQLKVAAERVDELSEDLEESNKHRKTQSTNLQIEKEWREALQSQIENHENEKSNLREQLRRFDSVTNELEEMKKQRDRLHEANLEQELTIQDLAGHLGKSKQEIGEIKEVQKSVVSSTWEKDKMVTECSQCNKSFNISRRKHHCRNCGQIFCNSCSDNVMALASSAKPVRVCDTCHTTLLQRFSVNIS